MKASRGFIILDKPAGCTSRQVVSRVKKCLGFSKAGHTGTLDPLATGVLPIALGSATKIIPFLNETQKTYQVTGRLGIQTDTLDAEGRVLSKKEWNGITREDFLACLPGFLGKIQQTPPIYSAVKVKGKALHRYARDGEEVEIPLRQIEVFSIRLLTWAPPHFTLEIQCSRGTYIRSIVHEMGCRLKAGAHVVQLRRMQTGPFRIGDSVALKELEESGPGVSEARLRPIEEFMNHLEEIPLLDPTEVQRVLSGVPLYRISEALARGGREGKSLALSYQSRLVALIQARENGEFQFQRVLGPGP